LVTGAESAAIACETADATFIPEEEDPNADNNELRLTPEIALIRLKYPLYFTTEVKKEDGGTVKSHRPA
jgi:hypothetical protein